MTKSFAAVTAVLLTTGVAMAADNTAVPNFSFMDGGWQAGGADFRAPANGPGPVTDDPGHVHVGNNTGAQPSFRIADLSNPICSPGFVMR